MARLFSPKNEDEEGASKELIDAVVQMKQAGYTEKEIIQALREQGYSPAEIQESLSRAEERGAEPYYPPPKPPQQSYEEYEGISGGEDSGFEEKSRVFSRDISDIKNWKDKTASRIDKIEQSLEDMKRQVSGLNKAIIGKVEDYEKNLLDVGTELKAMQKVFKDSLPELTGSIAELSRMTKEKKKGKV